MARCFDGFNDNVRNANGIVGADVQVFSMHCTFWMESDPGSNATETMAMLASAISSGQSAQEQSLRNNSGTTRIRFGYRWSTTIGNWDVTDTTIVTGQWYRYGVTYDRGSTTNNPTMFLDGLKKTVGSGITEQNTPVGTAKTGVDSITFGENVGNAGDSDIRFAEFGFWDIALDDAIFIAMGEDFVSPQAFPENRILYYRMSGRQDPEPELDQGADGIVTGAGFEHHPPTKYMVHSRNALVPQAAVNISLTMAPYIPA